MLFSSGLKKDAVAQYSHVLFQEVLQDQTFDSYSYDLSEKDLPSPQYSSWNTSPQQEPCEILFTEEHPVPCERVEMSSIEMFDGDNFNSDLPSLPKRGTSSLNTGYPELCSHIAEQMMKETFQFPITNNFQSLSSPSVSS